jgi:hypothetical protein
MRWPTGNRLRSRRNKSAAFNLLQAISGNACLLATLPPSDLSSNHRK